MLPATQHSLTHTHTHQTMSVLRAQGRAAAATSVHVIRKRVRFSGADVRQFFFDTPSEIEARGRRELVTEKLGEFGLIPTTKSKIREADPASAVPFKAVPTPPEVQPFYLLQPDGTLVIVVQGEEEWT